MHTSLNSSSAPSARLTVYGADWCHDTQNSRARLDELAIPYHYVNIDEDAEAKALVERLQGGGSKIPTILFGEDDESPLVEPTSDELETKLQQRGLMPT